MKNKNYLNKMKAEEAKNSSIIFMALGFSSMLRVFGTESDKKFFKRVKKIIPELKKIKEKKKFDKMHDCFCEWGKKNILQSHKPKKVPDEESNKPKEASYGQIAKTLNVCLKVIVYYSNILSKSKAEHLIPFLHPAIDNKMMKDLFKISPSNAPKNIKSIADVHKGEYTELLKLVDQYIDNHVSENKIIFKRPSLFV